jgi:hypothetical protein
MKALITGASSGIGKDMAIYLSELGYDLIVVARRKDKLKELKDMLTTDVRIIDLDLSNEKECYKLYDKVKKENIDILINNAGFGVHGNFYDTDLNKEIEMINLNIKTVHILTKLFLKDMKERNSGYILNVASSAAFIPGPLMATYYATKAYVLRLTESIYGELKKENINVKISALCPGPVATEFNSIAQVNFSYKALSSKYVARYGIDKMFKGKLVIIPGIKIKLAKFFSRLLPLKLLINFGYNNQKKKCKELK